MRDNFDIDYVAHEVGHQSGANNPTNCYTLRVQLGTASRGIFEQPFVSNDFTVSPNPARNTANLLFNAEVNALATISVTDRAGKVLIQNISAVAEGEKRSILDVSRLSGVCILSGYRSVMMNW